jgi:hypothetical protein
MLIFWTQERPSEKKERVGSKIANRSFGKSPRITDWKDPPPLAVKIKEPIDSFPGIHQTR